ncbi:MAG: ribosome maturation factor RimP [Myxococcales bacterium]|nr:ribosome maturation factor RimP [Myxococcales bacterium]
MAWTFIRETPLSRRIAELAAPVCTHCGVDLYFVEIVEGRRRSVVRVAIDAIGGVDIEDCAKVSRQLSAVLDVENPIQGSFVLEVSSPGLDRPLRHLDDMRQYVGQKVKVETKQPVEGRKRFSGKLIAVDEEAMQVEIDGRQYRVPAAAVRKANLVYDFGTTGK